MTAKPPPPHDASTALDLSRGEPVSGVIFVLRVIEGPDAGETKVLDGVNEGRVLVGQSSVCTLRLTDRSVSRRHAALRREPDAWRLEDLDSTNGTRVNGVRIKEAFLAGGEVVTVGSTSMRLTRAGSAAPDAPAEATRFGRFISGSPALRRYFGHWTGLAASSLPLLIEGETGTGKELLAEALHDVGPRGARPFVVLDCAVPGGADVESLHFDQARGGTLVIDEPAELDGAAQARLSVLLERASSADAAAAPRVIATSRRNLDMEVQHGRFREDLLYRLAGMTIELPPLRRRRGDVEVLARHFWAQLGGAGELSNEELTRLDAMAWPGNVRELSNAIAARLAVGPESARLISMRPGDPGRSTAERGPPADGVARILGMDLPYVRARQEMLREFEGLYVQRVLEQQGGNVSRAAAASGLARRYFQILKSRAR